jgi:hypothetical protein
MSIRALLVTIGAVVGAGAVAVAVADTETAPAEPAAVRADAPRTTVRDCRSRGEGSGRETTPPRHFLVMGSTRSTLDSFMDRDPSALAPVSEWVGFKRWLRGRRGQALSPAERDHVVRLAAVHYSQLKTPIAVRAGHTVTLTVAPEDRPYVSFMFAWTRGHQIGPYSGYRVRAGTPRVRFIACDADEPKFSGPGRVGPWTWYPGAIVVAGARCLTLEARERGRPTFRYYLGFGRKDCRPPEES